ncbi:Kinesin motor domain family protein [Candida albicans]|uniref:Kinesin motor domain family protein n=1 Tax=Candida albicans TaxID=5476 RepID=A0A8H6BX03_CANAX|nr:Kinesin motor domain family protein [Candida albicans]
MSHKTPTRARSCYANSSTTSMNSTPSRNSFRPPSRLSLIPRSSHLSNHLDLVQVQPNPNTIDNKNWSIDEFNNSIINTTDGTRFVFDNVFPMDRQLSNIQVYNKSCYNVVNKFLEEGYNGTIFAYGMTGSGKTFSMKGCENDPGIIPNNSQSNQDLKIRDDVDFGTKVVGLTSANISSKPQLLQLIKYGDTNRKTSATDFNARSSRSHSILQIRLQVIDLLTETELKSTNYKTTIKYGCIIEKFENSRIVQLESENRVLIEKLDHLTRLTDLQKTETAIIKNDILNDILASGLDNSQILMTNIEDFYKKMTYEANEYKSYICRLETQLRLESINSTQQQQSSSPTSSIPMTNTTNDSSELMDALKEQEEEILMLKEQLKDKDQ